jgi:hypothetical protein
LVSWQDLGVELSAAFREAASAEIAGIEKQRPIACPEEAVTQWESTAGTTFAKMFKEANLTPDKALTKDQLESLVGDQLYTSGGGLKEGGVLKEVGARTAFLTS